MKGNKKVIAELQQLLSGELAARDQYFAHARLCHDWGFEKLYEHIHHEMEEEAQHADALIKRILFLEGVADLSKRDDLDVGASVSEILRKDLALEYKVTAALKKAISVCEEAQDYQTREILRVMLEDTEEDHAYWLERQLRLIDAVGLQNYLQSQM
ncbi:MAG: bacterioferritin [Chromatiales bacterium]|jgi:bacterioferritin|nr:bacterioferritin [Chromatiales bacterium]